MTYLLRYVIERFMNVYQAVFLLFIWSFQEASFLQIYNPQNEMFSPCKTKCSKSKTKCLRFSTLPNHINNSVRTAFLPNSNAISISTYQCLSYHNFKALHIGELQAAIFRCLEKLFLVNFLDGYLYLGIGKV